MKYQSLFSEKKKKNCINLSFAEFAHRLVNVRYTQSGTNSPPKTENFQIKTSDIFHISAQNIDCEYSLEPPRRGGSNEYHNLCFEQK